MSTNSDDMTTNREVKLITESQLKLLDRIARDFTYHAPHLEDAEAMGSLRKLAHQLAAEIVISVPSGREQASALTRLEECIMHASAGIVRVR